MARLKCFHTSRPDLKSSAVTTLPTDMMGAEDSSKLKASLLVDNTNLLACAASARLWERLLEKYQVPLLLLLVADVRMTLDHPSIALPLYHELQTEIQDSNLASWINESHETISLTRRVTDSLRLSIDYAPGQNWWPERLNRPFPLFKLSKEAHSEIENLWSEVSEFENADRNLKTFHCIHTNDIEGVGTLEDSSYLLLLTHGLFFPNTRRETVVYTGELKDQPELFLRVLRGTNNALSRVMEMATSEHLTLTPTIICELHHTMLQGTQTVYLNDRDTFKYCAVGVTRQATQINVTARLPTGKMIQFCPYTEVDSYMAYFCHRFNMLMKSLDEGQLDVYACAAWVSQNFIDIHPFEDGNGRLSRMLASIPLVRRGLPPLCITMGTRSRCISALNTTRADTNTDYKNLTQFLAFSADMSLNVFRDMVSMKYNEAYLEDSCYRWREELEGKAEVEEWREW
ncbi:hypothetical protein ARMGADRAFT_1159518 [Armillaria gallica]|uniref:Fido domain-containing protein n=1 Tax=Armillaria gallica TaxID=47427 RepID=A0A2H3E1E6_ARMGA|nr:hypothetical protein ARMGADRAFT_1159518 [Armillaria gallica]